MDWLILAWTIFVCVVYIGGYFFSNPIGLLTTEFSKVYAIVLLGAIAASLLHARSKADNGTKKH